MMMFVSNFDLTLLISYPFLRVYKSNPCGNGGTLLHCYEQLSYPTLNVSTSHTIFNIYYHNNIIHKKKYILAMSE